MTDRFAPPTEDAEAVVARIIGRVAPGRGAPRAAVSSTAPTPGASLSAGYVAHTAALPAASEKLRGAIRVLRAAGVEDTLHLCVETSTAGVYAWRQVTLT